MGFFWVVEGFFWVFWGFCDFSGVFPGFFWGYWGFDLGLSDDGVFPAPIRCFRSTAEAAGLAAQAAEAAGTGRLVIPPTPRHSLGPIERRLSVLEVRKIAAPLFLQSPAGRGSVNMRRQQSPAGGGSVNMPAGNTADTCSTPRQRTAEKGTRGVSRPPGLPKPPPPHASNKCVEMASAHRMLFTMSSEDDLCRAVINQSL